MEGACSRPGSFSIEVNKTKRNINLCLGGNIHYLEEDILKYIQKNPVGGLAKNCIKNNCRLLIRI
jgi:hypothetical protein